MNVTLIYQIIDCHILPDPQSALCLKAFCGVLVLDTAKVFCYGYVTNNGNILILKVRFAKMQPWNNAERREGRLRYGSG